METKNTESHPLIMPSDGVSINYTIDQNRNDLYDILYAPTPNPLTEFYNRALYGDYEAMGVGLTATGSATIGITLPPGSSIEAAFLFWDVIRFGGYVGPILPGGKLNNINITGTLISTIDFGGDYIDGFYADVSSIAKEGINVLEDFPRGAFRVLQTDGASLVVVYSNFSKPFKTVLINKGLVAFYDDTIETTFQDFIVGNPPITAKTTYMVGQSSNGRDNAYFNNSMVGTNVFNNSSGPLWSNVSVDVSNLVNSGDTSATAEVHVPLSGILIWIAQVFSVNAPSQKVSTEVRGIDFCK
ncbi:DUF3344 domain-containing protein [Clostridium paridis]|uniref:DUF3344 domain-containing protein n=1 Tax=Clostridium paridis TaxID=2803863 RepID=A0A937FIZ6_9CLOT|nr:DUF3344 domain-containing protein [Clostridium paridis]MBL4933242.1 DUF3344 domain-containing protein [Clostridium paridis]